MRIKEYRKIATVEAIQWTGENLKQIIDFTGLHKSAKRWEWKEYEKIVCDCGLKIFTLEGSVMAKVGDYILKGVYGEVWPCDGKIFNKTYQEVNSDT